MSNYHVALTFKKVIGFYGGTVFLINYNQHYQFITVDMDEHNGRMANEMFLKNGYPFKAISAKGEDFLHQWQGEFHVVFLDG